jgi:hypothetical protein
VNKLPSVDGDTWTLAPHAHVIVYEALDGGELLTVYDCGAAQAPPSAQIGGISCARPPSTNSNASPRATS